MSSHTYLPTQLPPSMPRPAMTSDTTTWQRAGYRLRQFFQGVNASVAEEEIKELANCLPPEAGNLFLSLPVDAQRHSLNVLYTLQRQGYHHPALTAAALLHDVGKIAAEQRTGIKLGIWQRGPLVLLEKFAPTSLERWAGDWQENASAWRYILYVHIHHPQIGATWAAQAGCDSLTCWLIEHHQDDLQRKDWQPMVSANGESAQEGSDPDRTTLLSALQWADSIN